MNSAGSAREYALRLAEELNALGATLPENFLWLFLRECQRAGDGNHSELGTLLMIECLEAKKKCVPLDAQEIERALGRVRQRLVREAFGWRQKNSPLPEREIAARYEVPVEQRLEHAELARNLIAALDSHELRVLELWANGLTSSEAAKSLGIKDTTFRKSLQRLLEKLRTKYRDHRESANDE